MTTITIPRALLEQALEALLDARSLLHDGRKQDRALTALRSALSEEALQRLTDVHQEMEQPQQERPYLSPKLRAVLEQPQQKPDIYPDEAYEMGLERIAYYTAPPAPRRLTDGEIVDLWTDIALQNNGPGWHAIGKQFARAIEARILGGKT